MGCRISETVCGWKENVGGAWWLVRMGIRELTRISHRMVMREEESEDCDGKGSSQHATTIMIARASEVVMVREYVSAGFEMVKRGYKPSQ